MGGAGALDSLANKTVEINAANFALGQEETPLSPARATIVTGTGDDSIEFDHGLRLRTPDTGGLPDRRTCDDYDETLMVAQAHQQR